MRKGRAFQVFGSLLIAYMIWTGIKLLGFPVLSYKRIYVCITCILMIINSPAKNASVSDEAGTTVREEWVVDSASNKIELFRPSKYPRYKWSSKAGDGNVYTSDEGEILFTEYVTRTIGGGSSDRDEDWVRDWAVLILAGCILSFLLFGAFGFISEKFQEAQSAAEEFYTSTFGNMGDDTAEEIQSSDQDSGLSEGGGNEYGEDSEGEAEDDYENDYEDDYNVISYDEGTDAAYVDYGIFTDGHGITDQDYVIADSNLRKLTDADTRQLTLRGINYDKNEIYARHGRKFKSIELQGFFDSREWYDGRLEASRETDDQIQSEFNSYERYNCDLLYNLETSMGTYQLD